MNRSSRYRCDPVCRFRSVSLFGVRDGLRHEFVLIGAAFLSTLIQIELAWWRGRRRERAAGSGGDATQRARTLNYLTYDLGLALALAGAALAFTAIDSIGFALQEWKVAGNVSYAKAFSAIAALFMAGAL